MQGLRPQYRIHTIQIPVNEMCDAETMEFDGLNLRYVC